MCWNGEKGQTLYDVCKEKGLNMPEEEFKRKIKCLDCLTMKTILENTPDDGSIQAFSPTVVFPNWKTAQLKDSFYAVRTKECPKCPFLSGSKEKAASQLARLEHDLFYSGEGAAHVP